MSKISKADIIVHGGEAILLRSGGSVLELFRTAFPEHSWKALPARGYAPRRHTLQSIKRTREFLIALGHKLNIDPFDYSLWYKISYRTLESEPRGQRHLAKFGHSRFELFSTVFPEHEWHPWLFKSLHLVRNKSSPNELKSFLVHVEKLLGISKPEEWYGVTRADFEKIGLEGKFRKQSDLVDLLRSVYPNISWDVGKMAWSSLGLSHLHSTLSELFPDSVLYSKEFLIRLGRPPIPTLRDRVLVVPHSNLIFEYQGPISYAKPIMEAHESLLRFDSPDLKDLCCELSFTLISIPFWWNRDQSSILAEIFSRRKDLFEASAPLASHSSQASSSEPIPSSMPLKDLKVNSHYVTHWAQDPRFSHIEIRNP